MAGIALSQKTLMGCLFLITIAQGQITQPDTTIPQSRDVTTLCDNAICEEGTSCRVVAPCDSCPPEGTCVDLSKQQGIDDVCRNQEYLTSLLVGEQSTGFTEFKCVTSTDCPLGSVCVQDNGNGRCCTGKPTENDGICPVSLGIGVCGGEPCLFDNDCSGGRKCCNQGCGPLCTDPVPPVDDGCGGCPDGQTCVPRPVDCEPGLSCIEALLPTCVPDACAECRTDQECRQTPIPLQECLPGANCPEPTYFCGLRGFDECGRFAPCDKGFVCGTGRICADGPFVTPLDTTTTAAGPRVAAASATRTSNLLDPFCADIRICLPSKEKEGICPALPPNGFGICGGLCEEDSECSGTDKCCPSLCGSTVCTPAEEDLGCGQCEFGEVCVQKPGNCPKGVVCDIRPPECVPRACANCTDDQECRKIQNRAICPADAFCPEFTYFCGLKSSKQCDADRPCDRGERCEEGIICQDIIRPQGAQSQSLSSGRSNDGVLLDPFCADVSSCVPDECGGCPEGQECVDRGIRCVRPPCPSFECVRIDECGGCKEGYACKRTGPNCRPWEPCTRQLIYSCVPEVTCPKPVTPGSYYYCLMRRWFNQGCESDNDCGPWRKCCTDECGLPSCLDTKPKRKQPFYSPFGPVFGPRFRRPGFGKW